MVNNLHSKDYYEYYHEVDMEVEISRNASTIVLKVLFYTSEKPCMIRLFLLAIAARALSTIFLIDSGSTAIIM